MTHLLTIRRYDGKEYVVSLPKTVIDQVAGVKEHIENKTIHLSADEHVLLAKTVVLDAATGHVKEQNISKKVNLSQIIDFANKEAFDTALPTLTPGQLCMVTGETEGSWKLYKVTNNHEAVEIANSLSLDFQDVSYTTISKRPTSSTEAIDTMVEQNHLHENLATLDKLQDKTFEIRPADATTKTVYDGDVPPNTDGLGAGTMIFAIHDPKINRPLALNEERSLPSVLLHLDGAHKEEIVTTNTSENGVEYRTAISKISILNTSTNCNGTVRHIMTKQNNEEYTTDYLITPGETRVINVEQPAMYKKHDFIIVDIDAVGDVDRNKYGVTLDISCEQVKVPV